MKTAVDYLNKSADLLEQRGKDYDTKGGERSMGKTVEAFNIITGHTLTEPEGWLLMQLLKDVRQWTTEDYHEDSAEDCIAYAALKAESFSGYSATISNGDSITESSINIDYIDRRKAAQPESWYPYDERNSDTCVDRLVEQIEMYDAEPCKIWYEDRRKK